MLSRQSIPLDIPWTPTYSHASCIRGVLTPQMPDRLSLQERLQPTGRLPLGVSRRLSLIARALIAIKTVVGAWVDFEAAHRPGAHVSIFTRVAE
jgi:hypothetical protein